MHSKNMHTIKLRGLPCCEVTSIFCVLKCGFGLLYAAALIGYIHSTGDIDLNTFFLSEIVHCHVKCARQIDLTA